MLRGRRRQIITLAIASATLSACGGASAQAAAPIGAFTTQGAYTFLSAPRLHPPRIAADAVGQINLLSPGYFMVSNFKDLSQSQPMVGQGGPLILDNHLQPVWFNPVS